MTTEQPTIDIVGAGKVGLALTRALRDAGITVNGPHGRGADCQSAEVVLLCVPDSEIANAAAALSTGALVGHCSGASTLAPLGGHHAFSLHPLMTITGEATDFSGAACAIAGNDTAALNTAAWLATTLGMRPIEIDDEDRATYHAAASMASNFLITLETNAERLAHAVGLSREDFRPLVEATVANFFEHGERALTGPVARGDRETIAKQRAAIEQHIPEMTELYDVLVKSTEQLSTVAAPR